MELKLKGLSGQCSEDLVKLESPLKSEQNPAEIAKDSVPLVKEIQSVHIGDANQAGGFEDLVQRVVSMMEKSETFVQRKAKGLYLQSLWKGSEEERYKLDFSCFHVFRFSGFF